MASEGRKEQTTSARPPRMRSACTQCHAAKVRCSGQRTGCDRCHSNNLPCEYTLSMVGRASKRNKRANRSQSQSSVEREATGPEQALEANDALPNNSVEVVGQKIATAHAQMEDPLLWPQWSGQAIGSNDDDMLFNWNWTAPVQKDVEMPSPAQNPLKRQRPLEMFDLATDTLPAMQVDNMDIANPFGLHSSSSSIINSTMSRSPSSLFTVSSLTGSRSTSTTTTPASTTGRHAKMGTHTNYDDDPISVVATPASQLPDDSDKFHHVVALCKVVRVLEDQQSHQALETSSLDELMRVSRACMIDATRAMSLDGCRSCTSACTIILLIFDLILSLFEKMVRMLDESQNSVRPEETEGHGQQQQSQQRLIGSDPRLPTMQFGVLELDPEEQADFARKIVRKQLQRLLETFKIFSSFFQNSVTSDGREMLRQWYTVLKRRLETLVSVVGNERQ